MKILNKLIVITILSFSTFIVISCKDEKAINKNELNITNITDKEGDNKIIEFEIKFPDTIFVNKSQDGVIEYKSILDTITTSFGGKEKNRYTRFILATTDNVAYDFKHLKQIVKDTFGAINNRTIPFCDIKFTKSGIYYIDGIINDIVLIDLHEKDNEGNELYKLIENEIRLTHKIVVIDKQD